MANAVQRITATLKAALAELPPAETVNEADRMELLGTLERFRAAVEPPPLTLQKMNLAAQQVVVLRTAIGMGIFDSFASKNGAPMTLDELVRNSRTRGTKDLLLRFSRLLTTHGVIYATGKEQWIPGPVAKLLTGDGPAVQGVIMFHGHLAGYASLYDYLATHSFTTPTTITEAPWQHALQSPKPYQEWLKDHPEQRHAFNISMSGFQQYWPQPWHSFYPVRERLQAYCSSDVALVDIGGGLGHDARTFVEAYPDLVGRVVVQDLPEVVAAIQEPLPVGLEVMPHDMFTRQPLLHARAYYLRTVFIDWPDTEVLLALAHIKAAMGPMSVLLVNEYIMPTDEVSRVMPPIDLIQMTLFGGLVRSLEQWEKLLKKAGFAIVKIWRPSVFGVIPTALMECVQTEDSVASGESKFGETIDNVDEGGELTK